MERRRRRARELSHSVKTARDRIARKLASQKEELARSCCREDIRKCAELVTANMYRIKKGDSSVTVEDYYSDGCPPLEIALDPLKTPQANAAAMFKEYNKLKTAEAHLTALVAEGEKQLDYLNSVLEEIERATGETDLAEIRQELEHGGYLKTQSKSKQKPKKSELPFTLLKG